MSSTETSPTNSPSLSANLTRDLLSDDIFALERKAYSSDASDNSQPFSVAGFLNNMCSTVASTITDAANMVGGLFGRSVTFIKNIPSSISSLFSRVASSISSWANEFADSLCMAVRGKGSKENTESGAFELADVPGGQSVHQDGLAGDDEQNLVDQTKNNDVPPSMEDKVSSVENENRKPDDVDAGKIETKDDSHPSSESKIEISRDQTGGGGFEVNSQHSGLITISREASNMSSDFTSNTSSDFILISEAASTDSIGGLPIQDLSRQ